ncbi:MAG TPA: GyrI-like domain-containing protein [Dehalococcoidia bacterium]|nr:GyrI-like domain-containing protein [Dehalococcoidia bacterium]
MRVEFKEQKAQPVLSIRTRTNLTDLPKLIGDSYHKIAAYLEELGEKPADVPFTAYHNMDMKNMDVEMGFPVTRPLPGRGDIKAGKTAGGQVAVYMHTGPYSKLEVVYNEIFRQIAEKGCQPKGIYYEYYYNSPDEVLESELLTRIVIPLI